MGAVSPHPETESEINGQVKEKLRSGAFFFLARPEPRSLEELASLAGLIRTHLRKVADEPGAEVVEGPWAENVPVIGRLRQYEQHVSLELYFSGSVYFGKRQGIDIDSDLPLEQDPQRRIAYAFRDACLRLKPEVALITFSSIYASTRFVGEDIYPGVRRWDGYDLAQVADLLYVNEDVKYNLFDMYKIEERDQMPVDEGMMVFRGKGANRWIG